MTEAEARAERNKRLARERQRRHRQRGRANAIHLRLDVPEPIWFALFQHGMADPDAADEKAELAGAIVRHLQTWSRKKKV